jgi:drug/metabolite transporter (DMT)-like permease
MNPALWGLVSALSWGSADFLARLSGRRVGAVATTLGMLGSSTLLLTLWIWYSGTPLVWDREAGIYVLIAGSGVMAATLTFYAALTRGPVSVASPLIASYPAFVIVGAAFLGVLPTPIQWLAIVITMVGLWVICHAGAADARGGTPITMTVLLGLLSAMLFGVTVLAAREAVVVLGQTQTVWLVRVVAVVILVPYVVLTRSSARIPFAWWPVIAVMGILDVCAYLALLFGSVGRGAPLAAVTSAAFTVITLVLAWGFLRERIGPRQWLGVGLVVTGAAMLAYFGEAPD